MEDYPLRRASLMLRRYTRPISILLLLLGGLILALPQIWAEPLPEFSRLLGLSLIAYGAVLQLFSYLQGRSSLAKSEYAGSTQLESELSRIREAISRATLSPMGSELRNELRQLRSDLAKKTATTLSVTDEEKSELLADLRESVTKTLSDGFITAIEERYSEEARRSSFVAELLQDFTALRDRLREEIATLQRRSNSNLAIGSITTLLAMGSLAWIVLSTTGSFGNTTDLLAYYIPRVSFVVFIEVFSFFFLRLYKANLADIKFYQNELTNVDSKLIALRAALFEKREEDLAKILEQLAQTERNFVLKKDETTVELERGRLDLGMKKELLESLSDLAGRLRGKN